MWHALGRKEVRTEFCWGNLKKRRRNKWKNDSKMYLKEIGWGIANWIQLAENRHKWRTLTNTNKSSGSIKCGKFLD